MNVIEAKAAMRDLGTKAQAVVDDATLSGAEKMTRLEAYKVDLKAAQDVVAVHDFAQRLIAGGESAPEVKAGGENVAVKSIGRQIVESKAFKNAAASKGGRFSFTEEIGTKVAVTVDEGTTIANGQLAGAAGVLALPNYLPGIVDLRYSWLSVAELFSQGTTSSPIVSYVKEATETQVVDATAEKSRKGQADASFVRVNEQVGKIAAFFKITDEMLQDYDQAESFLSNRLIKQVDREMEREVLSGTGYPAIPGILGRAGLQASLSAGVTGTLAKPLLLAEAIHKQVTFIRTTAFVEPDAVVLNPIDWQFLRLAADANGQYFSGGPFTGSYGTGGFSNVDAVWGLRVVQSTRIPSGTALVGAFAEAGQIFHRQGTTIELANQNEDDFVNNLITVRAEMRCALAVYRPGAFGLVTITWA